MAVFRYSGFDGTGRGVSGTLEAPSERHALEQLAGEGVTPTELAAGEAEEKKAGAAGVLSSLGGRRVPMTVRVIFVRELATFIHADIPLLEALDVLRRQESHPAFKAVLDDVHDRVQGGESFSHALGNHPRVFSPLLINMARVGETGGLLGPVLEQMANWMEHEEEVRGEVRGAMAYPLMILLLGVATVAVLFTVVLPRITRVFAGEATLPWITQALMGLAAFMGQWWWAVLLGATATVFLARKALATPGGRRLYDQLSLRAPIFGLLVRKSAIARFARANAALLTSGVPLLEALRVVRGILENSLMAAMVDHAIERVTRGHSLAKALEEHPWFPPTVIHLLGVGERTGRLAEMFERVAQIFERQSRAQIKVMLNLLSPLLIVALAAMVALIAIAILLPIFRLNSMMR